MSALGFVPQASLRLFRQERPVVTAAAVADPSVTIIEVEPALGFLLADACHEIRDGAQLHLESVMWVRLRDGEVRLDRTFGEVAVYRHPAGAWVAQDAVSGQYLPSPSVDPYLVAFIGQREHEALVQAIDNLLVEQITAAMHTAIEGVPGFSFNGTSLTAPPHYARLPMDVLQPRGGAEAGRPFWRG